MTKCKEKKNKSVQKNIQIITYLFINSFLYGGDVVCSFVSSQNVMHSRDYKDVTMGKK